MARKYFSPSVSSLPLPSRLPSSTEPPSFFGVTRIVNSNTYLPTHARTHSLGMDYIKNAFNPIKQVAPRRTLRVLKEADVVLLAGEVHYKRKPVGLFSSFFSSFLSSSLFLLPSSISLFPCFFTRFSPCPNRNKLNLLTHTTNERQSSFRFSTPATRELFTDLILHRVRATRQMYELAETLARRMMALNGGIVCCNGSLLQIFNLTQFFSFLFRFFDEHPNP